MPTRRPNILITIADDQRADALSAAGHPVVRTPHLDALCDRGTRFARAYHPGSTHAAVCAPSRAQLHTGRSLYHTTDALNTVPDPARRDRDEGDPLPTLGQLLERAGYQTFGTGKWHNERPSFARSFEAGRRVFFGGMCSHFGVPIVHYDREGGYRGGGMDGGHSSDLFTDSAVQFLRERDEDRPFFLYVAFTAPHDPRETIWQYRQAYRAEDMPLPANYMATAPFDHGYQGRDEHLAEHPRSEAEIRQHLADYYAITAHMDACIGKIHAALGEAGVADRTIVVHTGDHGLGMGSHAQMGKQNMYEHSVRVPLIMAGPDMGRGVTDNRLCHMQDLFPTLLAAAGIEAPAHDFERLDAAQTRQHVSNGYDDLSRAVIGQRWKLAEYRVGDAPVTQLFDLESDPHELHNLAAVPEHAGAVGELRGTLKQLMQGRDDPHVAKFTG